MKSLSRLLLMMCAYLLIVGGIAQAQYITLDVSGATETAAYGVSGNYIVGEYYNGSYHGFLYDGSRYTTLYVPGSFETVARGIEGNNIVGEYYDNGVGTHGFLYDGSRYTTLDVPGASRTFPTGIDGNNIVGTYDNGIGTYSDRGFLYDGRRYMLLDVPGASRTFAYGISGNKIVGVYFDSVTVHGFLYDGSRYTTLDVPGASSTAALGIDGNNIVGYYIDSFGVHGFLYDGSRYTTLDVPGASHTEAFGISGDKIVGFYVDSTGVHGFRFTPIALSLSNVTAVVTGPTTATVSWTTTTPASSNVVEYGTTTSYGNGATDIGSATSHSASLNILRPNTLYHYRVKSTDANGRTVTSADGTFVTGPANAVLITVRYSNVRRLPDGRYTIDVTVRNIGGGVPSFVNLDSAYLRVTPLPTVVTYPTSPNLPMGLGPLHGPTAATITLTFPASAGSPGTRLLLDSGGSFNDPANSLFFIEHYSSRDYVRLP